MGNFELYIGMLLKIFDKPFDMILNYHRNKKLRKILNTKEIEFFHDKLDSKFKEKFILPDLKENFFYLQTGIYTNETSIEKYIELKKELGENFTWESIKIASPYLEFQNNKLIVKVSKLEKFFSRVLLASLLFLIIAIFFVVINYLKEFRTLSWADFIEFLILIICLIILAFYFRYLSDPLLRAISMTKKLN